MTITSLPTRGALDLGPALTNVRAPIANELSAVHVEKIKDRLIEVVGEVGLSDGSTAGSLVERVLALEAVDSGAWALASTAAATVSPSITADKGLILRVAVNASGTTINLPEAAGGEVLLLSCSGGAAAGAVVTLHPFAGQYVNHATGDLVLAGSNRYHAGAGARQAPILYLIFHDGNSWVVDHPALVSDAQTLSADGPLPDQDVTLVDTGGGPITADLPAVVSGVPLIRRIKKITTDANGITLGVAASEMIEGLASDLFLPGSDATDYPSWTIYRDMTGNWWLL